MERYEFRKETFREIRKQERETQSVIFKDRERLE